MTYKNKHMINILNLINIITINLININTNKFKLKS